MISHACTTESSFDMGSGDPNPDHRVCVIGKSLHHWTISLSHVVWMLHIISNKLACSELHIETPGQQVLALTVFIHFADTEVFCHKGLFLVSELPFLLVFWFSPASPRCSWPAVLSVIHVSVLFVFLSFILRDHTLFLLSFVYRLGRALWRAG